MSVFLFRYIDASKKFKDDSIPAADLELLDGLWQLLQDLLERSARLPIRPSSISVCFRPEYHYLTWVGSGLQRHYGHITVARQDVHGSVPRRSSARWFRTICALVEKVGAAPPHLLCHVTFPVLPGGCDR